MQHNSTAPKPVSETTAATTSGRSRPSSHPRTRQAPRPTPQNVYDRRTGEWTGQLPAPDLSVGPNPPPPKLDNTFHSLFRWVRSLKLPLKPQAAMLAIIDHVNWKTGRACYASIATLADEAGMSKREMERQLPILRSLGVIDRRRRLGKTAETWLVADHLPYQQVLDLKTDQPIRTPVISAREGGYTSAREGGYTSARKGGSITSSSSTNPLTNPFSCLLKKSLSNPTRQVGIKI